MPVQLLYYRLQVIGYRLNLSVDDLPVARGEGGAGHYSWTQDGVRTEGGGYNFSKESGQTLVAGGAVPGRPCCQDAGDYQVEMAVSSVLARPQELYLASWCEHTG